VIHGAQQTILDDIGAEPKTVEKIFSGNFDRLFDADWVLPAGSADWCADRFCRLIRVPFVRTSNPNRSAERVVRTDPENRSAEPFVYCFG
jgi:hypothetical protein